MVLDLRRMDERPGPSRVTVVASLETDLVPEQPARLQFGLGNPVLLAELHNALALTMAHGRGDLVAAEHGRIDVEYYQLIPVLAALRQPQVRLMIADDVGLGKTIEAGLILLELARRGRADRVLIACPAGLVDQWVEEMRFRFNLAFEKVDSRRWLELRRENPTSVSPWAAAPLAVSSIDYLKGNLAALQAAPRFDLVIVDEAHHVARSFAGNGRSSATDRSRLARAMADHCRELLLLSATPHNGYKESFASLVQLLGLHLAADDGRLNPGVVRPHIVRRLKDEVSRGEPPRPISAGRQVQAISVRPTGREQEIHQRLRGHSQRVLRALRDDRPGYVVQAFALEVLRKRALSSPYALRQSLLKRAASLGVQRTDQVVRARLDAQFRYRGDTPLPEEEHAEAETIALEGVASRMGDASFAEEQRLVGTLLEQVKRITPADDSKLTRLRGWLEGFWSAQRGERVIVFSEFRDTVDYLEKNLDLGRSVTVLRIDGTLSQRRRGAVLDEFARTPGAVLLATDAAGEGLNLQQAAHVVVHYELPWNPNRLEQRNGRVDRYGQPNLVQIRYLHLADTRDEEILARLREKLDEINRDLGSVSDVLGVAGQSDVVEGLLEGTSAEELETRLERAAAQVRAYLTESGALALLRGGQDQPASTDDVQAAREHARLLLPDFDDYRALVTSVVAQEAGGVHGTGEIITVRPGPILAQYPGVPAEEFQATFSRRTALLPENRGIAFLTPAHPLVRAVLQRVRRRLFETGQTNRVAARAVPAGTGTGWLVTFLGRVHLGDGRVVEEPLLPVFVPADSSGHPEIPSADELADLRRLRSRALRSDVTVLARERLADGFDTAVEVAKEEARRRLENRADQLRDQLLGDRARLEADLERWCVAELAEVDRRFIDYGGDDGVQLGLFADAGHRGFQTVEDARVAVAEEFARRRGTLDGIYTVGLVHGPEPVGCLLLVENA